MDASGGCVVRGGSTIGVGVGTGLEDKNGIEVDPMLGIEVRVGVIEIESGIEADTDIGMEVVIIGTGLEVEIIGLIVVVIGARVVEGTVAEEETNICAMKCSY